ncbi:MAG TPA: Os1348 family NHLP clan protein [Candidatus Limnocylindria bacterium]|nr:Os1348 family NHLP clan protein [Candidatus Limnocylindria bacterium]
MSKQALGQVVQRAISDAAFRRQLQSDPTGALKGFDLTADERAALRAGDASKLSSLGVDQRMSKAFALGEASQVSRAPSADTRLASATDGGGSDNAEAGIWGDQSGARAASASDATSDSQARLADIDAKISGIPSGTENWRAADVEGSPEAARSAMDAAAGSDSQARLADIDAKISGTPSGTENWRAADVEGSPEAARSAMDAAGGSDSQARLADIDARFNTADAADGSDSSAGTAYVTADEAGRDATGIAGGRPLFATSSAEAQDGSGGSFSISADEQGRGDATAVAGSDSNATSAQITADEFGRRAAASAGDSDAAGGTAYITADEAGRDSSALRSSDVAAREGDAFLTADEAGRDYVPEGGSLSRNMATDSADIQREMLEGGSGGGSPEHSSDGPEIQP